MMIVLILLLLTDQSYSSDQRCLLDGGGSTDTFFVREDSEVGAEVGRIRVNGRYHCINSINCIIITFYAGQSLWLTWITDLQCNNVLSIEIIKFEGN